MELVLALLGWCFVKELQWSAVPRECAPPGSVSYEFIRDWVIILWSFSVFLFGFPVSFFSRSVSRIFWPENVGQEFHFAKQREIGTEKRGHGKRFLEDGENDCDADVERLGM